MQVNKMGAGFGMLCIAFLLNIGMSVRAYGEAPPPDQTETDSGGGGDTGAGNGGNGSADPGTNQAGHVTPPPSCYVSTVPTWFPAGPPVGEDFVALGTPLNIGVRILYFDTSKRFTYTYFSTIDDPITPIPGTGEEWNDASQQSQSFYCVD